MILKWALGHPLQTAHYLVWRGLRKIKFRHQAARDSKISSYASSSFILGLPLLPTGLKVEVEPWLSLSRFYHAHQFDLLGSGWLKNPAPVETADPHGDWLEGRINQVNLAEARRVWRLTSPAYQPLDWQVDVKSGHRWSALTSYQSIEIVPGRGADIKMPWEFARGHHLPHLAMAYMASGGAEHAREFRDQILDFVAQNPPRFGVNWACAMDVAIRAVNWIVAFDMFLRAGFEFDQSFNQIFTRSLFEHGHFIDKNIEWHPIVRGNHYLANLTGLIFIAARLEKSEVSDRWLNFASKEILREIPRQFLEDGANFEGSTSYHRLSAEMAAFAAAVLSGPAASRVRALDLTAVFGRLERMAEFSMHLTKTNGLVAQIGDNDSGRLLKLENNFAAHKNFREEFLDHRPLISLLNGFFGRTDLDAFAGSAGLGRQWLNQLFAQCPIESYRRREISSRPEAVLIGKQQWRELEDLFAKTADERRRELKLAWPAGLGSTEAAHFAYPNFGAYVMRSGAYTVVIRCGSHRWDKSGGHCHNDQLSCEIEIAGEDKFRDPGTYLYTASPIERNRYRSTRAHFTPLIEGREQADLRTGLFFLADQAQAECLYFDGSRFAGVHHGFGYPVYRLLETNLTGLLIRDFTLGPDPLSPPAETLPFSDGYGRRVGT